MRLVSSELFHPATARWFEGAFEGPTAPQTAGWPAIRGGASTLIAAPTGSGKTLAAFLCAIDDLVRRGLDAGGLEDRVHAVYVSPLRALSHDVERNLERPLRGIAAALEDLGLPPVPIRVDVRTGDTPPARRQAASRRPPHLYVTTPESLFILLTSESGRRMLRTARTVIVDEIHAVVGDRRGAHLALSLERLDRLAGRRLQRIGLSATQHPIDEVARFLVGSRAVGPDGRPECAIVDSGHGRDLDLAIELPGSPLETAMSGETWEEVYDRLAELVGAHRTTIVFVNTRRLAERVARHLARRLGDDRVTAHHGSLSREHRLDAETRLKAGRLRALVATSSLELGIDVGEVDLVCQLGSTRRVSALMQRIGRSGHRLDRTPRGRLFPLSRDELVEAAALLDCVRRGVLDRLEIPSAPLDVLAQHVVAASAAEDVSEERLFELVRGAWPYRDLVRADFDAVVDMLAEGFATRRGRRGALVHHDAVNRRIRGRRGARLAAMTSGGAIPDNASYDVVLEPTGTKVGTVEEDFALENLPGHVFQLGNASYRILRIEPGRLRVESAPGAPPSIPFWFGEAPARSVELSEAVSRIRRAVGQALEHDGIEAAMRSLEAGGLSERAARDIAEYLAGAQAGLGVLPTLDTVVLERFFDEVGGQHLVLHAPFGSRVNRAWGLALRKRFCRTFNFELQAAATEDAVVLSLGPTHSFPLEEVFGYLRASSVRSVLVQALLDAPLFQTRWRWNAARSLAVLRFRGGRKVPPRLQRLAADDLLAVVFPEQAACLENVVGDREVPDHPLVRQTVGDCLVEAMDVAGLERVLERIERGEIRTVARDTTSPSPLAAAVLNARPYAFLDDAPLEERRTQAVASRRWLDPETASDLGALDPEAIARVRGEAWPDPRDADELHDALALAVAMPLEDVRRSGWEPWLDRLRAEGRATVATPRGAAPLAVAAERLAAVRAAHPGHCADPEIDPPVRAAGPAWTRESALVEMARGRLEAAGPLTAEEIATALCVARSDAVTALAALESEGFAMRGRFRPGAGEEWCDRRLLARIHRYTLHRLRREIEPVSAAEFVRFAADWQHVSPDARLEGPDALILALDRLEGFEAAAGAWEADLLPARVARYDPAWLDALCLSGRAAWFRRPTGPARERAAAPVRSTPIAIARRERAGSWLARGGGEPPAEPGGDAGRVLARLRERGASFFDDLLRDCGLLRTRLEEALGELVALGLVTSDGFSGLRALITPAARRRVAARRRSTGAAFGMEAAGRFTVLEPGEDDGERCAGIAWALLRRWGVVFRRLLHREAGLPPWIDLLRVLRRLEARGEIRGGRFVEGFGGEQFALPEAVGALRERRRTGADGSLVSVSAADPLNLVGLVTPGRRIPAIAVNRVLYRDGVPVAVREGGEVRILVETGAAERWELENALVKRAVPAAVRAYLGTAG